MKVVCDSCQAKYQVPDERVAGKKLKIRCKRCGATVLIRGDLLEAVGDASDVDLYSGHGLGQGAASSQDTLEVGNADRASSPDAVSFGELDSGRESEPPDESEPSDYEWHVSLDGDTQGPFATDAVRDWLNTTPGGWDAHVWREGFPDWLDARACAELGPAPAAPVMASLQDDDQPTQTFGASSFDGSAFMADIAAPRAAQSYAPRGHLAAETDAEAVGAAPRLRSSSYTSQPESSAAGYAAHSAAHSAGGGGFTSTIASAGSARPAASSGAGASYSPGPNPGFATGEASGLIDIRALASLARQSTTQIAKGADGTSSSKNGAGGRGAGSAAPPDSGLSFGNEQDARVAMANQPTGFGRLDSLAPVSHGVTSNAALPLAILGGCALVAAAVLAAVLFNKKPSTDVAVSPVPAQEQEQEQEQEQQQQSASAATAMPALAKDGKNGRAEDKAAPVQAAAAAAQTGADEARDPSAQDSEDEPVVAPASVEAAEAAKDEELSQGKRSQASQGASDSTDVNAHKEAVAEEKSKDKSKDKSKATKEDKAASKDSSDVMLAERAKPVKQAPTLTVTPLSGADADKSTDTAKTASSTAEPQLAAKPTSKTASGADRSIDDLLNGATGDKAASATSASTSTATSTPSGSSEDLPDTPSRDETLAAMRGVEAAVRACAADETVTGTAEVAINVAGGTGRVTSATVTGITGTVGSCIARAVRNARFPRFTKPTFSIKYPYRF